MNKELNFPDNIIVKGGLPLTQEVEDLVNDMLEIDLPSGITIDVGWIPEHDPNGKYRIVLYKKYWADQIEAPIYLDNRKMVVDKIYELVENY